MALNTGCSTAPKNAEEQPNILLILADDLGFNDLGFQGSKDLSTPNLDTLARNGVIFTDAHVTASVCSPSRAGLITGKYQQFFGHEANIPPPQLGTDTTLVTIADVLRDNGYRTGINGKWHIGYEYNYHPNSRGFDHFGDFWEVIAAISLKITLQKIIKRYIQIEHTPHLPEIILLIPKPTKQ